MIDLNKEAEDYSIKHHLDKHKYSGDKERISFIAGANSTHVQAKIIQAQIDVLEDLDFNPRENIVDFILNIKYKVKELQQQLKQLENETSNK